jgi:azurin/glucose/arabinose dehydrogenase/lysophospholipase L1-like esterase
MKSLSLTFPSLLAFSTAVIPCCVAPLYGAEFRLEPGDRIAIVGNALAERLQHDGWFETYLQAAYPDHKLVVRNLGYSGDQVHYRPRAHEAFGDSDLHLANTQASVVFGFFGYNESFADNPEEYRNQLSAWVDHVRNLKYLHGKAPRVVLFSPISHENLKNSLLPDGAENNKRLEKITKITAEVAKDKGLVHVDLFNASKKWYEGAKAPLTLNGIHLSEHGNEVLSRSVFREILKLEINLDPAKMQLLRESVIEKEAHWYQRYRAASANDVWGSRSSQDGNHAVQSRELQQLDVLTANRDLQVWARAKGGDHTINDSNVPKSAPVGTHITRDVRFLTPEQTRETFSTEDGLEVNVFAGEDKFPEIVNPVAVQVDPKGRLWVASWEDYPKWLPGTPVKDRLVILTDEDGDGKADQSKTFANVSQLTGFEFWNGGVIAVAAPDVYFLRDTNGDDVADEKTLIFTGLGADDTHHAANNLVFGPDGYIYYQRGIFILENVETPWRVSAESGSSGLYRFNPRTFDYSFVVANNPNPHGIAFDEWGHLLINDGTTGKAFQVYLDSSSKNPTEARFKARPLVATTVRPVAASMVLSSPHFPDDYQNNYLILNTIGYQGIKRYQLEHKPGGIIEGKNENNLLFTGVDPKFAPSSEATPRVVDPEYKGDPNFRPVDAVVGADGALYFADWHNPVITHGPYNLRDTSRDRKHGRIYRVTAKGRPLMKPVAIHGESISHLLELFRHPSEAVRHRVRVELSGRPTDEVTAQAASWSAALDPTKPADAIPLLEVLWLHQQHGARNPSLLEKARKIVDERAKSAVDLVAWHWSGADTYMKGLTDAKVSGMQSRTFFEPFWKVASGETPKPTAEVKAVDLRGSEKAKINVQASLMKFSIEAFTVEPSQHIELTLDNTDLMPHNLLIVAPGKIEEVSKLAMEMGVAGWGKHYVPESSDVLFATKLVDASKKETLQIKVPDKPGDYPFVCTFPGHAQMMRGIMKVEAKK